MSNTNTTTLWPHQQAEIRVARDAMRAGIQKQKATRFIRKLKQEAKA